MTYFFVSMTSGPAQRLAAAIPDIPPTGFLRVAEHNWNI
jgi:hypothetical protein